MYSIAKNKPYLIHVHFQLWHQSLWNIFQKQLGGDLSW